LLCFSILFDRTEVGKRANLLWWKGFPNSLQMVRFLLGPHRGLPGLSLSETAPEMPDFCGSDDTKPCAELVLISSYLPHSRVSLWRGILCTA